MSPPFKLLGSLGFIFAITFSAKALIFLPPFEIQGRAKQPLTFTPSFTNSTGTEQFSATGLPSGLTINPTTGVISGTPTNKVSNLLVTISASLTNATTSQIYLLNIRRNFRPPEIRSRLFKSIEIKWNPHRAEHEIDGKYRITARRNPTNFAVVFPVGQSGTDDEPIPWPTNWPDFKSRRGEIDFHYRETRRRIPTGKFKIQITAFNKAGSVSNTLELEITKRDE